MRILVASAFEASSQLANAINTVKMAQGFARLGHQVTIICRQPPEGIVSPEKLAKIYGLTESLVWVQLPSKIFGFSRCNSETTRFSLCAKLYFSLVN